MNVNVKKTSVKKTLSESGSENDLSESVKDLSEKVKVKKPQCHQWPNTGPQAGDQLTRMCQAICAARPRKKRTCCFWLFWLTPCLQT